MRILIVEDDPLLADGVAQLLRSAGFIADYVGSAELAEAALATENFDLLVLDIGLPGMDGLELLRRLRVRSNPIHVLMLTARDALNERVRGLNLGADDYLTKPFAAVELLARINALIRRTRGVALTEAGQRLLARARRYDQVLAMAPQNQPPASDNPADWARQLVTDPAYQLK